MEETEIEVIRCQYPKIDSEGFPTGQCEKSAIIRLRSSLGHTIPVCAEHKIVVPTHFPNEQFTEEEL